MILLEVAIKAQSLSCSGLEGNRLEHIPVDAFEGIQLRTLWVVFLLDDSNVYNWNSWRHLTKAFFGIQTPQTYIVHNEIVLSRALRRNQITTIPSGLFKKQKSLMMLWVHGPFFSWFTCMLQVHTYWSAIQEVARCAHELYVIMQCNDAAGLVWCLY